MLVVYAGVLGVYGCLGTGVGMGTGVGRHGYWCG